VLLTTEDERELARQSFWLYRANEAVVSLGTSDPPPEENSAHQHAFYAAFPALQGKRYLLFLSRLDEKKGCRLLIEAFAQLAKQNRELLLVMAGPDSSGLKSDLERLAASRRISDRVIWTGMITGAVKWGAFRAADAFVLTSHSENFGIVVAEALACGTPVLVSKRVNIWREVATAKAGMTADDHLDAAVSMLTEWTRQNTHHRRSMSINARELFLQKFEISVASQRIVVEFESVIQSPR
jgi:glycosyltransferase involved in cell wall biosynthesis